MIGSIFKNSHKIVKSGHLVTTAAIDVVDGAVSKISTEVDSYIAPVRQSVLNRFPILFSFLVTFGVSATFLGFEKLLTSIGVLDRHPTLVLLIGVSVLALTGSLYKKLS